MMAWPECRPWPLLVQCRDNYIPHHYLSQVFVNRDQLTGFGTPWEIRFQANYTVLRKGGNVDGYSALLSYIPDLKLGMYNWLLLTYLIWLKTCFTGLNVLWSGSVDEFATSNTAYDIIIPPFVEYLMTVQPPYPYPPNAKVQIHVLWALCCLVLHCISVWFMYSWCISGITKYCIPAYVEACFWIIINCCFTGVWRGVCVWRYWSRGENCEESASLDWLWYYWKCYPGL